MAACLLAVSGSGVAFAQSVDPLKVLEQSRREGLERDKRLARETAAWRQRVEANRAAQAEAQRKLDRGRAAATAAPTSPVAAVQPAAAPERGTAPDAPMPAASPPIPNEPTAAPARDAAVPPPNPATGLADAAVPPKPPAAPPVQEVAPAAPGPTASLPDPARDLPAPKPPAAPTAREAAAEPAPPSPPRVLITVDKASQRMRVTVDGKLRHLWPVSTGRPQYETPTGTFRPLHLAKEHFSREWDDAPMPHSIFFTARGHAIHGSNATRSLGRRASHGCVRLAPAKAAALFALVRAEGPGTTQVIVTGGTPAKAARARAVERRPSPRARDASPEAWSIRLGVGRLD